MKRTLRTRAYLILAAGLLMAGCSLASDPIPAGPIQSGPQPGETIVEDVPVSVPRALDGQMLYLQNCAVCHGAAGEGNAELLSQGIELPDFTDADFARQQTAQDWYRIITNGGANAMMQAYDGLLTDADRWSAAYYLFTLSASPDALAQGETLYEENFAGTYGAAGEAIGLNNIAMVAQLSQQDIYEAHIAESGADLSDDDAWTVAAYMQSFGYDASSASVALEPPELAAEEAEPEDAPEDEPTEEAPPQPENIVQGQVTMLTPGADLPDGLEVLLRGLSVNEQGVVVEFLTRSVELAGDGTYLFEDLPFDVPQSAYVVEVIHDGVNFTQGLIVDPANPSMDIPISLYENTTEESAVSIDAMHLIIQVNPDALLVTEVAVFSNNSDRIYVTGEAISGGRRGSIAISIPEDAYGLSMDGGELGGRFVADGGLVYDTEYLLPGERSQAMVAFYFLPYENAQEVEIPLNYRTEQVTLLVQEGQNVRTDQLNSAGVDVLENTAYDKFIGVELSADDVLTFRVQPKRFSGDSLTFILLAAAGVLIGGGAVYWIAQRRASRPLPAAGLSGQHEALLHEIAALDEAFEAGHISAFEYEARRADLKASLVEALNRNA